MLSIKFIGAIRVFLLMVGILLIAAICLVSQEKTVRQSKMGFNITHDQQFFLKNIPEENNQSFNLNMLQNIIPID